METPKKQKKLIFYKHRPDYLITILVLILVGIGLMLIYSTGWISVLKQTSGLSDNNSFFYGQLTSFFIAIAGWYIASKIDYHYWQKYASWLFWGSAILMFLVLIPGLAVNSGGASRWVKIGFINFQPVEFFKLGVVVFMAAWLSKNKKNLNKPLEGLLPFMIIIGLIILLVVIIQRDLGSAMSILLTTLVMFFVAGVPWWSIAVATGTLLGGSILLILIAPYRLARLMTFLSRASNDTSGSAYHVNQALIAIGSGGIVGRGLGKSLQAYGYLPEATNDSIFAIIGEEFGLIGTVGVVAAFSVLVWRGIQISRKAPDDFGKLAALGISCWIGFQSIINISAMLNLIPLTGVTLPFVSYGGTSLLALFVSIGILQNVSKYTHKEVYDEDLSGRRRDSRSHIAGTSRNRFHTKVKA